MKVLITGTGMVASHLSKALKAKGIDHAFTSTSKKEFLGQKCHYWNVEQMELDSEALEGVTHIIHLAGARIADKRWTAARKKVLLESRVNSAKLLFQKVQESGIQLQAFISASAIGYYGAITSEKVFQEDDLPADDFLANICVAWEQSADTFTELNIRVVKIRTGIVLADKHSALQKLAKPIVAGIGAPLGSGDQYFPWIHIDDLIGIYMEAITNEQIEGVFNAVSPEGTTNKELTKLVASVLNKRILVPRIPSFAIKIAFGELSVSLLEGSRVSAKKIIGHGFSFQHPELEETLKDLLPKKQYSH